MPEWRDRLVDQVWSDPRAAGHSPLQLWMGIEFRAVLRLAAESRQMGTSGYVRRAAAAFAAHDLGLDFIEVCSLAPPISADRSAGRRGKPAGTHGLDRDNGLGFGSWEVGCR